MKLVVQGDHRINLLTPPAHIPFHVTLNSKIQALVQSIYVLIKAIINYNNFYIILKISEVLIISFL